jgi:hypothetical protein
MAIKPKSCPSGETGRHHVGRAGLSIVTEMLFEEAVVQIIYIQIKSLQYSYKALHKHLPRSKKPLCVKQLHRTGPLIDPNLDSKILSILYTPRELWLLLK